MPVPEFSALSTSLMAGEWRLKCSRCGAEAWLTILPPLGCPLWVESGR